MDEEYKVGDVHAPVEDAKAPLGLKFLVFVMFLLMVGAFVFIVLTSEGLRAFILR